MLFQLLIKASALAKDSFDALVESRLAKREMLWLVELYNKITWFVLTRVEFLENKLCSCTKWMCVLDLLLITWYQECFTNKFDLLLQRKVNQNGKNQTSSRIRYRESSARGRVGGMVRSMGVVSNIERSSGQRWFGAKSDHSEYTGNES